NPHAKAAPSRRWIDVSASRPYERGYHAGRILDNAEIVAIVVAWGDRLNSRNTSLAKEDSDGNLDARPHVLPIAAIGDAGAGREARLRRRVRSRTRAPGSPHRGRCRPAVVDVLADRRPRCCIRRG